MPLQANVSFRRIFGVVFFFRARARRHPPTQLSGDLSHPRTYASTLTLTTSHARTLLYSYFSISPSKRQGRGARLHAI